MFSVRYGLDQLPFVYTLEDAILNLCHCCFCPFLSLKSGIDQLLTQGTWVWLADHDLDVPGEAQITVYSGRGILSESQGPVWMIGTACKFKLSLDLRVG